MVANPSKFQLIFLSKFKNLMKNMIFAWKTIKSVKLHVNYTKNNNFKRHIKIICCKAINKTKAPFHIRKFLFLSKHKYFQRYIFYPTLDSAHSFRCSAAKLVTVLL